MTTKQKLQQFKDYYLGGTLAVIAAAALIIFMVSRFLMPQKEAVLNIAVFDTELSDEAEAQLAQEIRTHLLKHHGFAWNAGKTVFYGLCDQCRKG